MMRSLQETARIITVSLSAASTTRYGTGAKNDVELTGDGHLVVRHEIKSSDSAVAGDNSVLVRAGKIGMVLKYNYDGRT